MASTSQSSETEMDCDDQGNRLLELSGLTNALQSGVCCVGCQSGPILYKEKKRHQGLYTSPYLFCSNCSKATPIPFSMVPSSKVRAINHKVVLANMCAGGNGATLQMMFALLDLPPPVSKKCLHWSFESNKRCCCLSSSRITRSSTKRGSRALWS